MVVHPHLNIPLLAEEVAEWIAVIRGGDDEKPMAEYAKSVAIDNAMMDKIFSEEEYCVPIMAYLFTVRRALASLEMTMIQAGGPDGIVSVQSAKSFLPTALELMSMGYALAIAEFQQGQKN